MKLTCQGVFAVIFCRPDFVTVELMVLLVFLKGDIVFYISDVT